MTNADIIRKFTDEELREFISYASSCSCCIYKDGSDCESDSSKSCRTGVLEWLEQEVKGKGPNYHTTISLPTRDLTESESELYDGLLKKEFEYGGIDLLNPPYWELDAEHPQFGNPFGTYKCSHCKKHSVDPYPFCYHCGSKMKPYIYSDGTIWEDDEE